MTTSSLSGRSALVTGASRGIGAACAVALAQAGVRLALAARNAIDTETVANQCRAFGVSVTVIPTDMREMDSVRALAEQVGTVDILVNNAGVLHLAPIYELTLQQWDESFNVNLRSVYYLTHLLAPAMMTARRGHIININSGAGYGIGGYGGGCAYAPTKFGLRAFSNSIRHDLHSFGIRVTQLYPGYVDTSIFGENPPVGIEKHLKPLDIASAMLYALTTPPHVDIPELLIVSYEQDW